MSKKFGIIALIISIFGILNCVVAGIISANMEPFNQEGFPDLSIPFVIIGFLIAIIAIIFGIIGIIKDDSAGFAIVGVVIGVATIIIEILMILFLPAINTFLYRLIPN